MISYLQAIAWSAGLLDRLLILFCPFTLCPFCLVVGVVVLKGYQMKYEQIVSGADFSIGFASSITIGAMAE